MVTARHITTWREFRDENKRGRVPGSFYLDTTPGKIEFWYCCPCGCGRVAPLRVGVNVKPDGSRDGRATWNWNGNTDKPTLTPSVHHVGHWHGWLTDGEWKSC